jgi:NAD(P)-dependent dehydrogenase (short-subunit alcohol dehydrogenase family)
MRDGQVRCAVVTGGAAGIGRAYAARLATDGHRVVVADVADASETCALIRERGGEVLAVRCDVASHESVADLRRAVEAEYGRCDVLVSNAGIYPYAMFDDTSWEQWRRIMSVNLDALFHLCRAFLPGMREAGWGRIIATASNTFHSGLAGLTPYVASKGGVIGFVRSLADEVGESGITINAIAPSLTRTPGTTGGQQEEWFGHVAETQAIKRTQLPADLAGALSFLASDDAAFITGQTLVVDGGSVRG